MKRKITINKKVYRMPEMSVDTYMDYLEVRDEIMDTEKQSGLYTRAQFEKLLECICELYGNQFTVDELKNSGLTVPQIITEFALVEAGMQEGVEKQVDKIQSNFTNGK